MTTQGEISMKRIAAGLLGIAALATAAVAQTADTKPENVKVKIDAGTLVGETRDGVNVFRGVPFAKAPVGELRWKAPVKADAWAGDRYAVAFEPPCPQPVNLDQKTSNGGGVSGVQSEDCLYLNVYAPANASNAPVVVWLYGGASFLGAGHLGSYNGTSNAKNGVITVPINYRLGPLGTFAHPALTKEGGNTGGFALMDAVAALEWVKRNAVSFGGDPNNVTIAGQSAGGMMVMNLLSVPSAKGLFQKVIVQSGAGLTQSQPLSAIEAKGAEAATALGLPGKDATAAQLRSVSAQTLVANATTQRGYSPPIDGKFKTTSTVDALNAGTEIDVPVMIGSNSGEGGFTNARTVARQAGDAGAGAWLYHFAYVPEFRKADWKAGAIHSAELMFSFDAVDTSSWGMSASGKADAADRAMAQKVNSCWVAFYKMDPKTKSLSCAGGFTWPAYTDAADDAAQFTNAGPKLAKAKTLPNGPPQN
jgi:para-nitrobenzyl esterase